MCQWQGFAGVWLFWEEMKLFEGGSGNKHAKIAVDTVYYSMYRSMVLLRIEYGWGYVWHNECNIYYEISVISARLPAS